MTALGLLTIAAARLLGYEGTHHQLLAATVEFIHTATLLHDDVVDESRQRRGRPKANLLWDNKSSVLVGDFLYSRSFQMMVEVEQLHILKTLADATNVIAEGEVFLMNPDVGDSLDGRYFGPFPASAVIGQAIPLFTDEDGDGRFVWRAPMR